MGLSLASCSVAPLAESVSYRSFRNTDSTKHGVTSLFDIPKTAQIAIEMQINNDYTVDVVVYNLTDETMSIDRTQSFFLFPRSQTAYFDPTVKTQTVTSGKSSGATVNLGSIANSVGVGGVVGGILGGVNVGGSSSSETSTTTYVADAPVVHIPPRAHASMGRSFDINDVVRGDGFSKQGDNECVFGVCIAYSVDRMATLDNMISVYSMNNFIVVPVMRNGKENYVNDALRRVYKMKPDLFSENYYRLYFKRRDDWNDNYGPWEWSSMPKLYDYK